MTGFGKSEFMLNNVNYSIEIKSLNGKNTDINLRISSIFRDKEIEIKKLISKALERGKIDISVRTNDNAINNNVQISDSIVKEYYRQLEPIARDLNIDSGNTDILATIMKLPDVLTTSKVELTDSEWDTFFKALNIAVVDLQNFRKQEGKALSDDILERVLKIEQLQNEIPKFEAERIELFTKRLREGLQKYNLATKEIDENRFEQELIYYLEKLDITEEKVRLHNHIKFFREVVIEERPVGKKLGFVSQEFGREINTIGSKANHSGIQRIVVQMKDELEKIKEQLLNIL